MGRNLDITQRQAVALMRAAKETGCAVEYDPTTGVVRILPDIPDTRPQTIRVVDQRQEIRL